MAGVTTYMVEEVCGVGKQLELWDGSLRERLLGALISPCQASQRAPQHCDYIHKLCCT